MGILVQKDDDRNGLTDRITADLRERAARNSKQEDLDLVKDSQYLDGTKRSSGTTMFWTIAAVLGVAALIVIFTLT